MLLGCQVDWLGFFRDPDVPREIRRAAFKIDGQPDTSIWIEDNESPATAEGAFFKLRGIASIRKLRIMSTVLDDSDLARLARFTALEELAVYCPYSATGQWLLYLKALKNLRKVTLKCSKIDDGLEHICALPTLRELKVHGIGLTDSGLTHLKGATQLEDLSLSGTKITDAGLAAMRDLHKLRKLDLYWTRISDAGLEHLQKLQDLEYLELSGQRSYRHDSKKPYDSAAGITDAGLRFLSGLRRLTYLGLGSTSVSDDGLVHLQAMHQLRYLNLDNTRITDDGLSHLKDLANLREIHMRGTATTGSGLRFLAGATHLHTIGVSRSFNDEGMANLKAFPEIRALELNVTQITDAGLANVAGMAWLERIRLFETRVSDAGLKHLEGLRNLKYIHLGDTDVTESGAKQLSERMPDVTIEGRTKVAGDGHNYRFGPWPRQDDARR
jgi:Leucine-rich repeat (LRR) protein